ncbi:hypothetical protein Slala03_53920 [Streptomyces lavendulae subsp. lavendulae]|nr:hypothetical protein Slala03_53920 [Streptomyces lavendulae subsp. lavendulae]
MVGQYADAQAEQTGRDGRQGGAVEAGRAGAGAGFRPRRVRGDGGGPAEGGVGRPGQRGQESA